MTAASLPLWDRWLSSLSFKSKVTQPENRFVSQKGIQSPFQKVLSVAPRSPEKLYKEHSSLYCWYWLSNEFFCPGVQWYSPGSGRQSLCYSLVISVLADHTLPWPLYKVEFVKELGRRAFLRAPSSFLALLRSQYFQRRASIISQLFQSWTIPCPSSGVGFLMWKGACWSYAERVPKYWPSLSCSYPDKQC